MTALMALALAFAILIGLLAVPLELQFRLSSGKGFEQRVRLVWAFGLARLSLPSGRTKPDKDAPEKARAKSRRRSRSRSRTRRAIDVLSNELLRATAQSTAAARRLLERSADHWRLSARALARALRTARTIADIEACNEVDKAHVAEALQLRQLDRRTGGFRLSARSAQ